MAIETDKLLALKAFYLGRAIADKSPHRNTALKLIDQATSQLEAIDDAKSRLRLLFYILLKAEILRGSGNAVALRRRAQSISEEVGSRSFDLFMNIEQGTQSLNKAYGLQTGIIANEGILTTTTYDVQGFYGTFTVTHDPATEAIGVDGTQLTSKERHFLYSTSLMEILVHHRIEHAP